MTAIPCRLVAACLVVFPAASAASLDLPHVEANPVVNITSISRGFDWNVPAAIVNPLLASIEEAAAARPKMTKLDPLPSIGPLVESKDPLEKGLLQLLLAIASLSVALGFIPHFHWRRARWKARHIHMPVHL